MNNDHLLLFGLYVTYLTLFSHEKDKKNFFPLAGNLSLCILKISMSISTYPSGIHAHMSCAKECRMAPPNFKGKGNCNLTICLGL